VSERACPTGSETGAEHLGQAQAQTGAHRREQLGGRLLGAPLELAEVTEGDGGGRRDIAQRAALVLTDLAQDLAQLVPKQDHGASSPSWMRTIEQA